jgi:hypothetical protein
MGLTNGAVFFRQHDKFGGQNAPEFLAVRLQRLHQIIGWDDFFGAFIYLVGLEFDQAFFFKFTDFVAQRTLTQILVVVDAFE